MTKILARVTRLAFLLALTAGAVAVMWWVSRPGDEQAALAAGGRVTPPSVAAQPRALVRVEPVEPAVRDVTIRYSGKIQAWEEYSLGFEIGGRVTALGETDAGEPLDDGDPVVIGQVLARLDERVLRAQLSEAVAQFELAAADVKRSRRVRERNPSAISEADFQNDVARLAQAKAAQEIAQKSLEDAVLRAPITGVIARRRVEAGESVGPNEPIFEVVENDRLRLVVNVPEARVRELELRRREVAAARSGGSGDAEAAVFRARIRLEGEDLYGRPWPSIDAEVNRIAETADQVTGLFEVEVEIPNGDALFRPGMVATAQIVTDRLLAYEVPEQAVLFRSGATYLFTLSTEPSAMPVLFWDVGETEVARARRVDLSRWIDQGEVVLVPAAELDVASVIVRGQQRLRDGQLVRPVGDPPSDIETTPGAQLSRTGGASDRG